MCSIELNPPRNCAIYNFQCKVYSYLDSTGYSTLPSQPRIMWHVVDTGYKQLSGHTHSVTACCRAPQQFHLLSGGKGNETKKLQFKPSLAKACKPGYN